jgi:hypothetical protein
MTLDPRTFMADLTSVNTEMASYIFASTGTDDRWPDEVFPPDREAALGDQMVRMGNALQERARHRHLRIDAVRPAEPSEHADEEVARDELRPIHDEQGDGQS